MECLRVHPSGCARVTLVDVGEHVRPVGMLAAHLDRFYCVMRERATADLRQLRACHGRMEWPRRGVYFFFEASEARPDGFQRVVRVGTHAVSANSRTTLWNRLSQHRGPNSGMGNHRSSIFRLHVGGALMGRGDGSLPNARTWGAKSKPSPGPERAAEQQIERAVSSHIGAMPFVFIDADDEPGRGSVRALIERNSIGLLAEARRSGLEAPSDAWLGRWCPHDAVRGSGLWNVNHVETGYDPAFLEVLETLARGMS